MDTFNIKVLFTCLRCIDLLAMIEHYIDRKQVEELEHVVIGAICLAKNPYLDK